MKKITISLFAVLLILVSASAGAFAASNLQSIKAYLNMGINLQVDGESWTPKDSNGNDVYPITYNNTTYLPVRAFGEAFGTEVGFDKNSDTVWIGDFTTPDGSAEQPTRGQPATYKDIAAAENKSEFINNNYANLIKSYPNTVDMKATDRTYIGLEQGWYKDSSGSAFVLWVKVVSLIPLDQRNPVSFVLVTPDGEIKPVMIQIDPKSIEKNNLHQLREVLLDITFELPDGISPLDCKLRMYDGVDQVDLTVQ